VKLTLSPICRSDEEDGRETFMGIPYDEIAVSTKREINLFERAIRKLKKDLADLERNCQMTVREAVKGFGKGDIARAAPAHTRH
jgi:hypothetical protein